MQRPLLFLIRRLGSYLLNLIFPLRCVGCQRSGQLFCDACAQEVPAAPAQQVCHLCRQSLPADPAALGKPCAGCQNPLIFVRSAALHTYPLRPAIHALKYRNTEDQPSDPVNYLRAVEIARKLTNYLHATAMEAPWPAIMAGLDGVVPVPLHVEKMSKRGYNQAGLLAEDLASRSAVPFLDGALGRVNATRSQVGLTALERLENMKGAFQAAPEQVQGKSLLLVDDVYTTGATMRECAAALRRAGASTVFGLALARPVPGEQQPFSVMDTPPHNEL